MRTHTAVPALFLVLAIAACGGSESGGASTASADTSHTGGMQAAAAARSIEITAPADGDTVNGPSVAVTMVPHGFTIVAAGDSTPNSGHLHLFLDRDLSAPDQPIPAEPGFIVHMGNGASDYTFATVAPGPHRLIAVVGNAIHVPLQPWVVDTVNFVVR